MLKRRLVAAVCAAPLAWALPAFADPAPSPGATGATAPQAQSASQAPDVATLLFSDPQWGQAPAGSTITYDFSRKTTDASLGSPLDDKIVVKLAAGDDAQSRTANITAFTQHSPQPAGPYVSDKQNPVLLIVLENNIQELSRLFKANPRYFKSAIRRAWREKAKVERTTVDVDGKSVPGTRITVQPFLNDPQAGRMMGLDSMVYTVDVADGVPGNLASVDIHAPATGTPKFSETLHYEAIKKS